MCVTEPWTSPGRPGVGSRSTWRTMPGFHGGWQGFVAKTPREMAESYRRFPLVADPRSSSRSTSRSAAVQRALSALHHALCGRFVAGEVAGINAPARIWANRAEVRSETEMV